LTCCKDTERLENDTMGAKIRREFSTRKSNIEATKKVYELCEQWLVILEELIDFVHKYLLAKVRIAPKSRS
jgi:hypothetical protein